jgi:hypothetical protein
VIQKLPPRGLILKMAILSVHLKYSRVFFFLGDARMNLWRLSFPDELEKVKSPVG